MPFDRDGRIAPDVARRWLSEHLDPSKGVRAALRPAPAVASGATDAAGLDHAHGYLAAAQHAICETPVNIVIFGAAIGLPRGTADCLADFAMLAIWHELGEAAARAGFLADADDLVLPADAADWRERVNWPALFDAAGAARPAGRT
jgi:hypothetical protein